MAYQKSLYEKVMDGELEDVQETCTKIADGSSCMNIDYAADVYSSTYKVEEREMYYAIKDRVIEIRSRR